MNRRNFLTKAGFASLAGALVPARLASKASAETPASPPWASDDFYARLKVRPVVNAMGTVTFLGGSIMAPATLAAMGEASRRFVVMTELLEKAGEHIAGLLGVPGALITTGGAGSITLGTAACVAGGDMEKIQRLPDTQGMRNEVVMQESHRNEYETQIRIVGAKIITIETMGQFERAVGPRTAMLFFMNKADPKGKIRREEWIALGKKHGIPTYADAAADIPPREHLWSYVRMGFDLVGFSGGKGLMGPQSTGLLLGRKDLIDAARLNASPYDMTIGRSMKVGKEEIAGLVTALESYLAADIPAELRQLQSRVDRIARAMAGINGVRTEVFVPEVANHVPHLAVRWDAARIPISSADVRKRLMEGEPRVAVLDFGQNALAVSVLMLRPGEEPIVASRLREVLAS